MKIVGFIPALILALSVSTAALAGTAGQITYTPSAVYATVPAGSEATIITNFDVVNATAFTLALRPFLGISDGNLPQEWISASSGFQFLNPGSPITVPFTVSVPESAPSGTYSGHLRSEARSAHGIADPGNGFFISIAVPSKCGVPAGILLSSPDTIVLWPPNHSMDSVRITGSINLPAGCTLLETTYRIDDEYGIYTSIGTLSINGDNTFSVIIPVEAWRDGNDKDGRHYRITLFARDEAGLGPSSAINVVVPHDQRK